MNLINNQSSSFRAAPIASSEQIIWKPMIRQLRYAVSFLGPLVGYCLLWPTLGAAQNFIDGDFPNWSFDSLAWAGSSGTTEVLRNQGNPESCLECTTVSGLAYCRCINNAAIWNPRVDGVVSNVTMKIDVKSISGWGDGQAIAVLVVQGGKYYAAFGSSTAAGSQT